MIPIVLNQMHFNTCKLYFQVCHLKKMEGDIIQLSSQENRLEKIQSNDINFVHPKYLIGLLNTYKLIIQKISSALPVYIFSQQRKLECQGGSFRTKFFANIGVTERYEYERYEFFVYRINGEVKIVSKFCHHSTPFSTWKFSEKRLNEDFIL